ncbi:MAG: Flp pilus assembly protein RcpC/CpaB [Polyangiaceae bacterium]|jgi:pilus assembly protein CpaB|nr:Flp pilus assembly protein RcpC/CpaB [Polyangiaceae bacterium]
MNKRALVVSLVMALLGTALLLLYLRKFEREMSGGEPVELLMVQKPIERGKVITDDMLTTRSVPLAYVEDRAIKSAERSKVLGLQTSVALYPQQSLMWTDLAITTEDRDLSSLIQPGKRAIAVRASTGQDDTRGNQLIRPGDYVDVIATFHGDQNQGEQSSAVLLQRVLVLAVGIETQSVSDAKTRGDERRDKQLTLSLSLPEAQLLALASERGRLSVAVRPPGDPGTLDDLPDLKASALMDTKVRADVQRRPSTPQAPVRIEASNIR